MQYFVIMWRGPLLTTADPKFERKIPALIADFCTYYAPHANHSVIYYYDVTALGSNYAVNDQDFHWVVVQSLNGMVGVCKMYILATPCDMMKSTCSSIKDFQASNGSCHTSTAKCCANENKVKLVWTLSSAANIRKTKQWRSYSCGAIGRRGTWKKWLSQKQVHREKSRIRGGLVGASHRWHWCFWYAVYWVWKVPAAWFLWSWWSEIKSRRLTILVRICEPSCFLSIMLIIK